MVELAKYSVADSERCSVGSWNCWPRSAFYEVECNLLVDSAPLARQLEKKFEAAAELNAIRISDPASLLEKGGDWCPLGCSLCQPFGPKGLYTIPSRV